MSAATTIKVGDLPIAVGRLTRRFTRTNVCAHGEGVLVGVCCTFLLGDGQDAHHATLDTEIEVPCGAFGPHSEGERCTHSSEYRRGFADGFRAGRASLLTEREQG